MTAPANANGARRRALRKRVLAAETHCHICGKIVDKTLGMILGQHGPRCSNADCAGCVPHPGRAEVDEIDPRSNGGSPYKRSNTALVHRLCNQQKGDKIGWTPNQPTPTAKPRTSRIW